MQTNEYLNKKHDNAVAILLIIIIIIKPLSPNVPEAIEFCLYQMFDYAEMSRVGKQTLAERNSGLGKRHHHIIH